MAGRGYIRCPPRHLPRRAQQLAAAGEPRKGKGTTVGYGNRLTAEQIAALQPGDTVTIESGADFARPRHTTGTVARFDRAHVVIRTKGPRGVKYVQRFSLRTGLREGSGRAELVTPGDETAPARRRTQRIDAAYRHWSRHRGDVEALRELHAAVGEYLEEALVD